MYFLPETHSFFATLLHFGRYQQFSDAVYRVYANISTQVQKLGIDWESYRHLSRGGQLGRIAQWAKWHAWRLRGRRFESGRWSRYSRFPRPNPVARRVFQFHDWVGVEFHAPFYWQCLKEYDHFSAVRKMRLYLRLTSVCTPSLFDRDFKHF